MSKDNNDVEVNDTSKNVSKEILEKLQNEISSTQNSIVSEDVRKRIEEEKEKARQEALAQVEKERLMQEKEAEILRLKKEREESERKNAEILEQLKKQVDEMSSSRAVYTQEDESKDLRNRNPFNSVDDIKREIMTMPQDDFKDFERKSMEAFLEQKQRR